MDSINHSVCTNVTINDGYCYGLPVCGYCYDFNKTLEPWDAYELYNLMIIRIFLPVIGLFGLFGNGVSAFIYSRKSMRSSMNIYLCALAISDTIIILTAFFLFFIENLRYKSLLLSEIFAILTPLAFPLGLTAQSLSVFLTVTSAIDCYILIYSNPNFKRRFCSTSSSLKIVAIIFMLAMLYNSPHMLEISVITCWNVIYAEKSIDVCPSDLRQSQLYLTVYYAWLYTAIMAVGPVLILIVLNSLIIIGLRNALSVSGESDIITLVLVVCLFITCNVLPLTVNFLELIVGYVNSYLIDLSNLMVVLNSSCNFLIYFAFGSRFRKTLKEYAEMIFFRGSASQTFPNSVPEKA
uniref:G-protein coupled receptors family 1 profile domain-containing protein n=1 Tax=Setaria digitata TaxID=48799 RepID=A0A915Q692_9BILA